MQKLPNEIIDKIFAYTDPETCVKNEKIYLLKYFPEVTMDWAAEKGHLEVVKYLHSIGKDCTTRGTTLAAADGHLEVLKYLHEIGKEFTTSAMDVACQYGRLEIVKYLHSIGEDCTMYGRDYATLNGHREVVEYLFSIGKKYPHGVCRPHWWQENRIEQGLSIELPFEIVFPRK
jgi:ankyrin repeat protein